MASLILLLEVKVEIRKHSLSLTIRTTIKNEIISILDKSYDYSSGYIFGMTNPWLHFQWLHFRYDILSLVQTCHNSHKNRKIRRVSCLLCSCIHCVHTCRKSQQLTCCASTEAEKSAAMQLYEANWDAAAISMRSHLP